MTFNERRRRSEPTPRELRLEITRDLAGPLYEELVRSRRVAFAHLFHADRNVRIAAIHVYDCLWNCSDDIAFVNACRKLAATDADDSVRVAAIDTLGTALEATQDASASQFLGDIVKDSRTSDELRDSAYWALRHIQLGINDEEIVKRLISHRKLTLRMGVPPIDSQEQEKKALLAGFPESVWDTADEIDWDFVDRYASRR